MNRMQFMLITPVPEVAAYVESRGVDRIFIDMETLGKQERQAQWNTPKYQHSYKDVTAVKKVLKQAKVLLRINPIHEGSKNEVDRGIDAGADTLMLPYFRYPEEVKQFLELVDNRVKTNILFESSEAVGRAEQILSLPGLQEVHFGLNDLKIGLKTDFLFEAFAGGLIDWLCSLAKKYTLSYGIGGIGRIGKEMLPAELILKENIRVGSERTILSRVFHNESQTVEELLKYVNFEKAILDLRTAEEAAVRRSPIEVELDRQEFVRCVKMVADKIRSTK